MNARVMQVVKGVATLLITSSDNKHRCMENVNVDAAKRLCMDENSPFDNVYAVGMLYQSSSNLAMRPIRSFLTTGPQ